jgi:hypothetical protein
VAPWSSFSPGTLKHVGLGLLMVAQDVIDAIVRKLPGRWGCPLGLI